MGLSEPQPAVTKIAITTVAEYFRPNVIRELRTMQMDSLFSSCQENSPALPRNLASKCMGQQIARASAATALLRLYDTQSTAAKNPHLRIEVPLFQHS